MICTDMYWYILVCTGMYYSTSIYIYICSGTTRVTVFVIKC